jgi:anti-anti-sigma regulatory factor
MTVSHQALGREVLVHFEGDVDVLDAIALPGLVRSFPADETVTLDFSSVRRMGAAAAAALIPAIGSLHGRAVRAFGLTALDPDLARLCGAAA